MRWYINVLKNHVTFDSRAPRKAYWFSHLFSVMIIFTLATFAADAHTLIGHSGLGPLPRIYDMAPRLPGLALSIRRLRDTRRSDWRLVLGVVPVLGVCMFLVLMGIDEETDANEYGPDPKADDLYAPPAATRAW